MLGRAYPGRAKVEEVDGVLALWLAPFIDEISVEGDQCHALACKNQGTESKQNPRDPRDG